MTVDEIGARLGAHVEADELLGLAWLVAHGDDVATGAIGHLDAERAAPVRTETIFRISSMTKPLTAVAAAILIDDGVLDPAEPVDRLLPELADRRVLTHPAAEIADTVPARRPITVDDLLTFRLGWGMDFTDFTPKPLDAAWSELGLGWGPPRPAELPDPDTWLDRLGTLPLQYQPGERWLYHVGAPILGFLVGRAARKPLSEFLAECVLGPLGMVDTGFSVPADKLDRFGPHYSDRDGARVLFDPVDGQWSTPPVFEGGGDGLVSTLADYYRFARMLRAGGELDGVRILSERAVATLSANHLTAEQLAAGGPNGDGSAGWGHGVGVLLSDLPDGPRAGSYGWSGGLGSTWSNDGEVTGVLLTNQTWSSSGPLPVFATFESILGEVARRGRGV
ncbi:serine hydrolase domain-containing protein [Nocardia asteroides]|uniref:serine hydrolase domain-containing protein n=1 Tax=Nocardia asteroides TaxID=1824 RepID=UPI001E313420|nr:serine hydrolase domain-containing protein [Nocardia asteroides]UGT58019.1 beta-lactamase family protein [Nocardia asteroides]